MSHPERCPCGRLRHRRRCADHKKPDWHVVNFYPHDKAEHGTDGRLVCEPCDGEVCQK